MSGINYAGMGLSLLSMGGILFSTISREWKRNSAESSQANLHQVYSTFGLWVRCTSPFPGQFSCDAYDTALFGVEPYLQAQRAMMVLACVFILGAVVTSTMALPCTAALSGKPKRQVALTGGVLAILAGRNDFKTWSQHFSTGSSSP